MAAAIGVRTDHAAADLRRLARRCGDPDQVRRLLAMALILDRLLHRAHVLNIKGRSYRLRDLEDALKA